MKRTEVCAKIFEKFQRKFVSSFDSFVFVAFSLLLCQWEWNRRLVRPDTNAWRRAVRGGRYATKGWERLLRGSVDRLFSTMPAFRVVGISPPT